MAELAGELAGGEYRTECHGRGQNQVKELTWSPMVAVETGEVDGGCGTTVKSGEAGSAVQRGRRRSKR